MVLAQLKKYSRIARIKEPEPGLVRLRLQRIFILPTRRGFLMALTIGLVLLMALADNNNLIYFLGFLLFSLFFIAILHTYRNLAGLEVRHGYAQPVFAGEAAGFVITVNNPFAQARPALSVKMADELNFNLVAFDSRTLILYTPTEQRGWLAMPAISLSGTYPAGIYRAWSPITFAAKVLVYPRPAALSLPFPLSGGAPASGRQRPEPQGNEDYNGVRQYQSGDSLRQIHWQAYAKGQGLLSKQYANSVQSTQLWLDYAHTPGQHREERLSRLCRWIIDAEYAGLSYGLQLPTMTLPPANGPQHYAACLEALALF